MSLYEIDFRKWGKAVLLEFIEFIEVNYPDRLKELLNNYDEMCRGN